MSLCGTYILLVNMIYVAEAIAQNQRSRIQDGLYEGQRWTTCSMQALLLIPSSTCTWTSLWREKFLICFKLSSCVFFTKISNYSCEHTRKFCQIQDIHTALKPVVLLSENKLSGSVLCPTGNDCRFCIENNERPVTACKSFHGCPFEKNMQRHVPFLRGTSATFMKPIASKRSAVGSIQGTVFMNANQQENVDGN